MVDARDEAAHRCPPPAPRAAARRRRLLLGGVTSWALLTAGTMVLLSAFTS